MISVIKLIGADWNRYLYAYDHKNNKKSIFLKTAIFFHNPNMFFLCMYRIEQYLYNHEFFVIRYLGYVLYPLYFYINYFIFNIHIHPLTRIGPGLYMHYKGIIITKSTKAQENLTLIGPLTIGTDFF